MGECEELFQKTKNEKDFRFDREIILNREDKEKPIENKLYICDNIKAMKDLLDKGYTCKLDLIYIDPPFFTKANYNHRVEIANGEKRDVIKSFAYEDKWENQLIVYLEMITIRLFFLRELLSERGTIYVHLDPKAVHYVKIIMDYIFGRNRFLNEIIWSYKSGGTGRRSFSRKHDNILVYTKTDKYIFNPQKEKSYNRGLKPYRFKNVKEYEDDIGWHTLVNLKDVWQIDMVGRTSGERVGYATQKPETLLERIILSSTDKDSIVADFFAGSGTTAVTAQKNNRRWIVSDLGKISELVIRKRLSNLEDVNYQLLNGKSNRSIDIDIDIEYKKKENILDISLDRYKIDVKRLELNIADEKMIKNILKIDSLNLIEYIGIGYKDKNGDLVIFKESNRDLKSLKIESDFSIDIDSNEKENLHLKLIDIFGNSICKKIF